MGRKRNGSEKKWKRKLNEERSGAAADDNNGSKKGKGPSTINTVVGNFLQEQLSQFLLDNGVSLEAAMDTWLLSPVVHMALLSYGPLPPSNDPSRELKRRVEWLKKRISSMPGFKESEARYQFWLSKSLQERRVASRQLPPKECTLWRRGVSMKVLCEDVLFTSDDVQKLAESNFGPVREIMITDRAEMECLVFFQDSASAAQALERGYVSERIWHIFKLCPKTYLDRTEPELMKLVFLDEEERKQAAKERQAHFGRGDASARRRQLEKTTSPVLENHGVFIRMNELMTDESVYRFLGGLVKDLKIELNKAEIKRNCTLRVTYAFTNWTGVVHRLLFLGTSWIEGYPVVIQQMKPRK